MALDIHLYENGGMGRLLRQLDDRAYNALFPAFEVFRQGGLLPEKWSII